MEYLQFHLENFTLLERSNKLKSKLINKTKNKLVLLSDMSPDLSSDNHFVVRGEIETYPDVTNDCFQSGDSFLRVLIVCDVQDRPALTTHPHTSCLTLDTGDNHTISLYSHPLRVSSIRSLSVELSDKSRHCYDHLPLSSALW